MVIVSESYLFTRNFPNILYKAYPRPEPSPSNTALKEILPEEDKTPVTSISPPRVMRSEMTFFFVIFSLKRNKDMIITKTGAV